MDHQPPSAAPASTLARLRAANTVMAIVILLMLGQLAWQQMRTSSLKAERDQAHRDLTYKVEALANQKVQRHREEMVAAVAFVDELYRSSDGLQRPAGLYNPEARRVDAEAIGTWILDVYMKARIEGKTDLEARQTIADAVKGSDEWRRKHAK